MTKRKNQVYYKAIQGFVKEHGRVPTEAELHKVIGTSELYTPMASLVVPRDKAISNPKFYSTTVSGLLEDGYDIMDLITYQADKIKQLRISMQAREDEVEDNLRSSIDKIRFQELADTSIDYIVNTVPDVDERLSDNVIKMNNTISLLPDRAYPVEYIVTKITPFTDGRVRRKRLGKDFSLPYTAIIDSKESTYSGIQIELALKAKALVTKLEFKGSPLFITIEGLGADSSDWFEIISKQLRGDESIAISESLTHMRITMTQDIQRSTIGIRDLRLFQELYPPNGIYSSAPIPLKGAGLLEFDIEQYTPDGTDISWEYAIDMPVSGDYLDSASHSVPLDSPEFESAVYSYSAVNRELTYASTYGYDLDETFHSPTGVPMEGQSILYNIESGNYPEFQGSSIIINDHTSLIDLATINKNAVDTLTSVSFGKDAWIFRVGTLERAVIDETGIRRMAMTGFPHWMTHLLVDQDGFELDIDDPFERIRYVILEHNSRVTILTRPYKTPLSKGIWKCTLAIDDDFVASNGTLSTDNRAILYSGINPLTAVPTTDKNGATIKFYINPYPVPIVSKQQLYNDPDYLDFQKIAIDQRVNEKHIIMPNMSVDPSSVDLISSTFNINLLEDIYTVENIPKFFDITYMQEVSNPAEFIFVRARLTTDSKYLTPVIRGITASVSNVRPFLPEHIKKLK